MRECTFVVGIDSAVVVSMSDMSTFDRESLHENETCENSKNILICSMSAVIERIVVRERTSETNDVFAVAASSENPRTRTRSVM